MAELTPHIEKILIVCDHRHVAVHKFWHRGGNKLSRTNRNVVYRGLCGSKLLIYTRLTRKLTTKYLPVLHYMTFSCKLTVGDIIAASLLLYFFLQQTFSQIGGMTWKMTSTRVPRHRPPQWPCPKRTSTAARLDRVVGVRPACTQCDGKMAIFINIFLRSTNFHLLNTSKKFWFTSVKHVWVTYFTNILSAL
jgi:hypothetical protein